MSTQKALFVVEPKSEYAVKDAPILEPGPGEVSVEIRATALNPVDWKIQAFNFFITEYPAILGTDAAGVIHKVGEGVTNVKVGDKVYVKLIVLKFDNADLCPQSFPGLLRQQARHVSAVRDCRG